MTTQNLLLAGALCGALACAIASAEPPAKDARGEPKLRATLDHVVGVRALAYSADGKWLASAGTYGPRAPGGKGSVPVCVWDTATNKVVRAFDTTEDSIFTVGFGPNGKLFTGSRKSVLWDANTGKELFRCKGHRDVVEVGAFAPDGKTLVTCERYQPSRVWDVATGEEKAQIPHGTYSLTYTPDGKALVFSTARAIKVWDVATNKERETIKPARGEAYRVAVSPDGKRIAYANYQYRPDALDEEYTVRVIDFAGKEQLRLRGNRMPLDGLAFSPDGALVLSSDVSVRLWDANTGERLAVIPETEFVVAAFSPDGNTVAVGVRNEVKLWDISALRKKK